MKKLVTAFSVFLLLTGSSFAQDRKLKTAPPSFRTFFTSFRRAVIRKDKVAVAKSVQFPLKYAFDAGDEGTFNKREFLAKFDNVFGDEPERYMADEYLSWSRYRKDIIIVSNSSDASHLNFMRTRGRYLLVGFYSER